MIALCRDSVGDRAHLCTLAACRRADLGHAKQWLNRVPATKRTAVQAECKDAGLDLGTARSKVATPPKSDAAKDCVNDPMACQH